MPIVCFSLPIDLYSVHNYGALLFKKFFPIITFNYFFQYVRERNLNHINFKIFFKKVLMHHPVAKDCPGLISKSWLQKMFQIMIVQVYWLNHGSQDLKKENHVQN